MFRNGMHVMITRPNETQPILHYGICPSCHAKTPFDLKGVQRWDAEIAAQLNVPPIMTVWQCRNCDTTLMEPSIIPIEQDD